MAKEKFSFMTTASFKSFICNFFLFFFFKKATIILLRSNAFLAFFLSASVSLSTQELNYEGKIPDSKVLIQFALESGHNSIKAYSAFHYIIGFLLLQIPKTVQETVWLWRSEPLGSK